MAASQEVILTSCLNDSAVSAYMYDAHNGTLLMTYRGDTSLPSCGLSVLARQYLVAALQNKPFLRVWAVNGQQQTTTRLVCPGRVAHAVVSPDHCYIAVSIAEKIHVYQFASGRLVGSGCRHFQPVSVVRWSQDGSLLVSGGEDALVTVWPLANLTKSQSSPEPRFVFSDHSLPVTDLVLTRGSRPRLLSISVDRTCKIYELSTGVMLVSLVFDKLLTAVTISTLETEVFVGTDSGPVLQFSLLTPPRQQQYHLTREESSPVFVGHSASVRCLSASACGTLLLSGSVDCSVKVWHIESKQCLRTLPLKGPVTNAFFCARPDQLFSHELQASVVISDFQSSGGELADCVAVITKQSLALCETPDSPLFPEQRDASDARVKSLQTEVDLLRSINANLYKFTVDKIIKENSHIDKVSNRERMTGPQLKRQRRKKSAVSGDSNKQIVVQPAERNNGLPKRNRKKKNRNRKKLATN